MGGSNGAWGELVEDESRELWDSLDPLPEPGQHALLDAFVAQKRLTHQALVRIGTRIQGDTLAFAFPDGVKFRDLATNQRWNELGVEWRSLKIVPAGPTPADTLVIAEGETDAARLTLLLPDVDVAVLPAGARVWRPTFTEQVRSYQRVLVATDADTAGDQGAQTIIDAVPHAVRYRPPDGVTDWCELDGDPPPLPDVEPPEVYGGLRRVRLGAAIEAGLHPPEPLVEGLLHSQGVHWMYGRPGSGKTTLAMWCCERAMLDGRRVVWIDYEGGEHVTALRLQDMEIPLRLAERDQDIDDWFYYFPWPDRPAEALAELSRELAPDGPAPLVVFDSASKALGLHGLDENSNAEVTAWNAVVVRAAKQIRLPVVVIDHVAKHTNSGPRGAGAKSADADVVWHVETPRGHEWSRSRGGMLTASLADKGDRYGVFERQRWFDVHVDGALRLEPAEPPDDGDDAPAI